MVSLFLYMDPFVPSFQYSMAWPLKPFLEFSCFCFVGRGLTSCELISTMPFGLLCMAFSPLAASWGFSFSLFLLSGWYKKKKRFKLHIVSSDDCCNWCYLCWASLSPPNFSPPFSWPSQPSPCKGKCFFFLTLQGFRLWSSPSWPLSTPLEAMMVVFTLVDPPIFFFLVYPSRA